MDGDSIFNSFTIFPGDMESSIEFYESGLISVNSHFISVSEPLIIFNNNEDITIILDSVALKTTRSGLSIGLQSEEENSLFNGEIIINNTEEYLIKPRMGLNRYWFYGREDYPLTTIDLHMKNNTLVELQFNIEFPVSIGITTDLEDIINKDRELWRESDYELYEWDLFPHMLIMDTDSYEIQSNFFKRLAFYLEKKGYVGELLDEQILNSLHGWNAHDYRAYDLAKFFNEAEKTGFVLNESELLLKELLIENEVLKESGDRVIAIQGGILSISRDSSERLRWLFLTHECYHGVFFSSDEYIVRVTEIWNSLADEEREFWRIFLDMYGYNIHDEYLLINEFQAYLMQQDISLADSYFNGKIQWIIGIKPYLNSFMERLLALHGDTFYKSAAAVENAAYTLTGIRAGDLVLKRKK